MFLCWQQTSPGLNSARSVGAGSVVLVLMLLARPLAVSVATLDCLWIHGNACSSAGWLPEALSQRRWPLSFRSGLSRPASSGPVVFRAWSS